VRAIGENATRSSIVVEPMRAEDWPQVEAIYRAGIATGNATFETETPTWEQWDACHLPAARLVVRQDGRLLGWAALSPVSSSQAYAGVTEVSVYVAEEARGAGLGKLLLRGLIEHAEQNGIWTLQAGIFPENVASIRLHQTCGFRIVGTRERIGRLYGKWRDTALMERRSSTIGQ
jgi:L-amino acid N-acyltransferase YncA